MMESNLVIMLLMILTISSKAQSLIGSWQLVRETTCQETHLPKDISAYNKIPQVIKFIDGQSGEENAKILNTRKNANNKHFLYKTDSTSLYILDKKSHMIAETYNIDSYQGDTLILSNSSRACETKVFTKIK